MKFSFPKNRALRILFIVLLIPFTFSFLPFVLGALIIYALCKRTNNDTARTVLLVLLLIPTLFIGSAWVLGVTQGLTTPVVLPTPTPVQSVLTPTINIPTTSPTFTPVPLVSPTSTRKVTPTPRAMKKIVVPSVTQAPDNIPTDTIHP